MHFGCIIKGGFDLIYAYIMKTHTEEVGKLIFICHSMFAE